MAYLFPHVSRGHLHYLPKLLYWGILTHHKSHPSLPGQWLLVTSHSGAATSTVQLCNTANTTKRFRVPISSRSPTGPAGPGILSSNFCLCRFALCGHFISTDSCRKWPFVSGFFHLAQCFGGSPMWQQKAEVHHFSSIYAIPLYGYRILCLLLSSWQILGCFTIWRLQTVLLWKTFKDKYLCEHRFHLSFLHDFISCFAWCTG